MWFLQGFFRVNLRVFLGLLKVFLAIYVKNAENSERISAKSPQRVNNHVPREGHEVEPSQHSGRPQSTVKVTKNEVPNNHPKRVWGIAQVLAVDIDINSLIGKVT